MYVCDLYTHVQHSQSISIRRGFGRTQNNIHVHTYVSVCLSVCLSLSVRVSLSVSVLNAHTSLYFVYVDTRTCVINFA